jgi:phosphate/sulfate permease
MGLGACMKCIKYSLFIFNFIFWLIGAALLSFGLWLRFAPNARELVSSHNQAVQGIEGAAIVVIVIGSIIMLLGFLGCCGSILENKCMLVVFFILMTLIFLVVLASALIVTVGWLQHKEEAKKGIESFFRNHTRDYKSDEDVREQMDGFQIMLKCCGAFGRSDYNGPPPESCGNHTKGCAPVAEAMLEDYWVKIVIALFTTAFLVLIGMVISMMLCCALRDEYD